MSGHNDSLQKKLCILTLRQNDSMACFLSKIEGYKVDIKLLDDTHDLLGAATECRVQILKTVIEKSPQSLYELAKILEKNQAYIYREAKLLKRLGLLEFTSSNVDGRKRVQPICLYDEILIHL